MSTGLLALLDDIAVIARAAAASLDDVAAQSGKATAKAAGVVIDDAAVTPGYVVGMSPSRELPAILAIAKGSLFNKIVILTPVALALSALAPWAITPLLIAGGLYLAYEGAEKIYEKLAPHPAAEHEAIVHGIASADADEQKDPADAARAFEAMRVKSAIRTDFILSAEIMAITLAAATTSPFVAQAAILVIVGIVITAAVYGVVAVIVKADDVGLAMVRSGGSRARLGRAIVAMMPTALRVLSAVGTAAMLWVGGGIVIHGAAQLGFAGLEHSVTEGAEAAARALPSVAGAASWLFMAATSGVFGLVVGLAIIPLVELVGRSLQPKRSSAR